MKLRIGYSSCPNDTFIFYAMVHGKINCRGLEPEPYIADVETLNRMARNHELEVTKLSYHALAHVAEAYRLLNAGSALGRGCGPLLIARKEIPPEAAFINPMRIAIPGRLTTANLLLGIAFPEAANKTEMVFSEIEEAVLKQKVDAGLIIHENRFTYEAKGLKKIIDLGEYWENLTGLPIPLGGIVVSRALPRDVQQTVNAVLRDSVAWAFEHPEETMPYVRSLAQEMDEEVMRQHIGLYVNDYTLDLDTEGREAVRMLLGTASRQGIIPTLPEGNIFLPAPRE